MDLLSDSNCKPMLFLRKDIFHKLKTNFTLEMVPGTCEFSLFSNLYFYSNFCLVTEDGTDLFLIMNHLSGKVPSNCKFLLPEMFLNCTLIVSSDMKAKEIECLFILVQLWTVIRNIGLTSFSFSFGVIFCPVKCLL